jgi:hypothetical protein
MKVEIKIYLKKSKRPIILFDESDMSLNEYAMNINQIFETSKVIHLELSTGIFVIRQPLEIFGVFIFQRKEKDLINLDNLDDILIIKNDENDENLSQNETNENINIDDKIENDLEEEKVLEIDDEEENIGD